MRIAFISSSVPRKCGIATYTRDLSDALITLGHTITHIAMQNNGALQYPDSVKHIIRQEQKSDYTRAADALNKSDIDFVHIQHEFGLFGGDDGEYILELVRNLKKPFIVTFHTVLLEPNGKKLPITQELARLSRAVIVMEEIAQDRLVRIYGVNPHDIHVIYHGVPDSANVSKEVAKERLGFNDKFVVLSSNLISRNKGYEYVIESLPKAIKTIPNILFAIVGETHPVVRKQEGESYRDELTALVNKLGVSDNVTFINEYIPLKKLRMYLAAADVCITPYLDAQQITSGTLAYAVGVGKVCISTPYIYAQHILEQGRGIIVPFRDSASIAKALKHVYTNPRKRTSIEKRALRFGKEMKWPRVAQKHVSVYKKTIARSEDIAWKTRLFLLKKPNLSYFEYFTDTTGIYQHANFTVPDLRFGYATDDNARALIVSSLIYKETKSKKYLQLLNTFVKFLQFSQTDDGTFHTFLDYQGHWSDKPGVNDAYGRSMWGFGYHLYTCQSSPFFAVVDTMFQKSMTQIKKIRYPHNAAYTILGLYYYIKASKRKKDSVAEAKKHLIFLSDLLVERYKRHKDAEWEWFDVLMNYDNFRMPQALFAAYMLTNKKVYKDVGMRTLAFAMKHNYDAEKEFFDFIGQNGWLVKGKEKAFYDQQPIEPAGAVGAHVFAYLASKKKEHLYMAKRAFEWYFGRNRNHTIMYDKKSGGVFDGLKPAGINQNEGSENIVCFLIAQLTLQKYIHLIHEN